MSPTESLSESSLTAMRRRTRSNLPTLRGRVGASVLFVAFVSMLAIWIGVSSSLDEFASGSGGTRLGRALESLESALHLHKRAQLGEARAAAASPQLRAALEAKPIDRAHVQSLLVSLRDPKKSSLLVLRDADGQVIASAPKLAPEDLALAPRAQLTAIDETTRNGIAQVGDRLSLATRIELRRGGERVATLLSAERMLSSLADELSRATSANVAIIVDDRVQSCAGSLEACTLSQEQLHSIVDVAADGAPENMLIDDQGFFALAKALTPNARIVLSQSTAAIRDLRDSMRAHFIPIALVVLLATLVLAGLVARRLTRPIAELAQVAHGIAGGALETEVPNDGGSAEIASLQDAFRGMTGRLRDVLEDVQNKNEVLASQRDELARANRAKSNFLATASHELRTPISSIRSFSEILLAGDADDEPEETREEFLGIIRGESVRLARLVEQLLDLAKIESGVASWHNEELDLGEVAERTLRALEGFAQERSVGLELVDCGPREYPYRGDPDRLQQTITNLVGNAVKFSPPGTRVRVEIERDDFGYQIFVDDEGPGVPEAERGRIFEKFVQSDDILTDKPQGSGLGLAIVREIVTVHGGRVRCDAAPTGGARFVVRLPEPHALRPLERYIAEAEAAESASA